MSDTFDPKLNFIDWEQLIQPPILGKALNQLYAQGQENHLNIEYIKDQVLKGMSTEFPRTVKDVSHIPQLAHYYHGTYNPTFSTFTNQFAIRGTGHHLELSNIHLSVFEFDFSTIFDSSYEHSQDILVIHNLIPSNRLFPAPNVEPTLAAHTAFGKAVIRMKGGGAIPCDLVIDAYVPSDAWLGFTSSLGFEPISLSKVNQTGEHTGQFGAITCTGYIISFE